MLSNILKNYNIETDTDRNIFIGTRVEVRVIFLIKFKDITRLSK